MKKKLLRLLKRDKIFNNKCSDWNLNNRNKGKRVTKNISHQQIILGHLSQNSLYKNSCK